MPSLNSGHNNVFIITSVISPVTTSLSYSTVRSVYTPEVRAQQTLDTLLSIRKLQLPSCKIFVIEMGLDKHIAMEALEGVADKIIFMGNDLFVRWACDCKYKGLGESVGLLFAGWKLKTEGDFFIKISGRYSLNDKFNLKEWDRKKFNFKMYDTDISTRLYGFPAELFSRWQCALARSIPQLMSGKQIETVLPEFIPEKNINYIDTLGVEGLVAPDGSYINE